MPFELNCALGIELCQKKIELCRSLEPPRAHFIDDRFLSGPVSLMTKGQYARPFQELHSGHSGPQYVLTAAIVLVCFPLDTRKPVPFWVPYRQLMTLDDLATVLRLQIESYKKSGNLVFDHHATSKDFWITKRVSFSKAVRATFDWKILAKQKIVPQDLLSTQDLNSWPKIIDRPQAMSPYDVIQVRLIVNVYLGNFEGDPIEIQHWPDQSIVEIVEKTYCEDQCEVFSVVVLEHSHIKGAMIFSKASSQDSPQAENEQPDQTCPEAKCHNLLVNLLQPYLLITTKMVHFNLWIH